MIDGTTEDPGAGGPVILAAIWRARWWVLLAVVLAGAGGYLYGSRQPVSYEATTKVIISADGPFDSVGGGGGGNASRFVADQVSTMTSSTVLRMAATQLGNVDAGTLGASLQVNSSPNDSSMLVTAQAPTALAAADRANAVVAAYRQYVTEQVRQEADRAAAATTDPNTADSIRTRAAAYGDGVSLVDPAVPPGDRTNPRPVRDGVLVAAVAAVVAMGLALVRRPPVTSAALLSGPAAPRVLGTVPVRRRRPGRPVHLSPADCAMALVALDYARTGLPGPVLLTETGSGAAPRVAYGLAVSAAAQGRRVLLLDAEPDERELLRISGVARPNVPIERWGTSTSVLPDVLVRTPGPAPDSPDISLAVVGSGKHSLVDSARVGTALQELGAEFDLVLIQTGPLAGSPLALSLVRHAATVVAVLDRKQDPQPLTAVRAIVATTGRPFAGVILTHRARRLGRERVQLVPGPVVRPGGPAGSNGGGPARDAGAPPQRVVSSSPDQNRPGVPPTSTPRDHSRPSDDAT